MRRSRTSQAAIGEDSDRSEVSAGSKSQASLGDLDNTHNDKKFKQFQIEMLGQKQEIEGILDRYSSNRMTQS